MSWIISFTTESKRKKEETQERKRMEYSSFSIESNIEKENQCMILNEVKWRKKKTKRGESKKEPGAGSERDETMVVMKPQIFWLGMPWRWWSGLKAFASGRSKLGILETSK